MSLCCTDVAMLKSFTISLGTSISARCLWFSLNSATISLTRFMSVREAFGGALDGTATAAVVLRFGFNLILKEKLRNVLRREERVVSLFELDDVVHHVAAFARARRLLALVGAVPVLEHALLLLGAESEVLGEVRVDDLAQ